MNLIYIFDLLLIDVSTFCEAFCIKSNSNCFHNMKTTNKQYYIFEVLAFSNYKEIHSFFILQESDVVENVWNSIQINETTIDHKSIKNGNEKKRRGRERSRNSWHNDNKSDSIKNNSTNNTKESLVYSKKRAMETISGTKSTFGNEKKNRK